MPLGDLALDEISNLHVLTPQGGYRNPSDSNRDVSLHQTMSPSVNSYPFVFLFILLLTLLFPPRTYVDFSVTIRSGITAKIYFAR